MVDGLFYMVSDNGVISCREPRTGEFVWQKRVEGDFAASPIHANGHLYFFGMEGDVFVLKPGREFVLVQQTKIGSGFMASPAVVGNQLILRGKEKLYCLSN